MRDAPAALFEYEIYFPSVEEARLVPWRHRLLAHFGGLTEFRQRIEGSWRVGRSVVEDDLILLRVLATDRRGARRFLRSLKRELEAELRQDEVLVTERAVGGL
jgi:hypothetical protein